MQPSNLHFRRFEFKYRLDRQTASRLTSELLNYMEWDNYTGKKGFYECHSLYFDTQDKRAYHETMQNKTYRKKIRIRSYQNNFLENPQLFFEIKRKSGEVITKDRMFFSGYDLESFVEDPFSLLESKKNAQNLLAENRGQKIDENSDDDFLDELLFDMSRESMHPQIFVSCKRKAFFAKNNRDFRVTFDEDLNFSEYGKDPQDQTKIRSTEDFIILEVKFNGRLPKWFQAIIEAYKLERKGTSKYCLGIQKIFQDSVPFSD